MSGVWRRLASLGPVGHARRAPGTAGSLVALAAGAGLLRAGPGAIRLAALASIPVGWLAVRALPEADRDPGWVVIDEVAGQWIAMLGLRRATPAGLLAAFALFRAFDIAKPGPVGWADRKHGATGVMLDDVIAGAMAAAVLSFIPRIGRR